MPYEPLDPTYLVGLLVNCVYSQDPLRPQPEGEWVDEVAALRYFVAEEHVERLEIMIDELRRLRALPPEQAAARFPVSAVGVTSIEELPLPEWLDVQIERLAGAIEDKRAGRLSRVQP